MKYKNIVKATFVERPNRFIAICLIDGKEEVVHVKNTGRCKELLIKGVTVYLQKSHNENRKTKYDLISVFRHNQIINIDSSAPNAVVGEYISDAMVLKNPTLIKPEVKFGDSRLDFYIENEDEKMFAEVKGVTLKIGDKAVFPDAPTARGTRHMEELISAVKQGYNAAVIFVVQMKDCRVFCPNKDTDKEFSDALKNAKDAGVKIIAFDCKITEDTIIYNKNLEVEV